MTTMAVQLTLKTDSWSETLELESTLEKEPWQLLKCIAGTLPYGTRRADGWTRMPLERWDWYALHQYVMKASERADFMAAGYPEDEDLATVKLRLQMALEKVEERFTRRHG